MATNDPFGFVRAINNIPKDKKTVDKLHKILVNKKVRKKIIPNKNYMKRILDIKKINWNTVEVEFFDGRLNSPNYSKRKVIFPSINSGSGAYIIWNNKKKIVESLYL